ncbi:hypothetical protein V5799_009981, partial [Amblyomma americanum]
MSKHTSNLSSTSKIRQKIGRGGSHVKAVTGTTSSHPAGSPIVSSVPAANEGPRTYDQIPTDKPLASDAGSMPSPPIPAGEQGNQRELDAGIPRDKPLASETGVAPSPPIPAGAQENQQELGDASSLRSPVELAAVAIASEAASPPTLAQVTMSKQTSRRSSSTKSRHKIGRSGSDVNAVTGTTASHPAGSPIVSSVQAANEEPGTYDQIPTDKSLVSDAGSMPLPPIPAGEQCNQRKLDAGVPRDMPLASGTGSVFSPPIPTGEPGNQQELDAGIPRDMPLASGTGVAPSPPIPAGAQEHHQQLGDASPLGSPADLAAVANASEAASPPTVTMSKQSGRRSSSTKSRHKIGRSGSDEKAVTGTTASHPAGSPIVSSVQAANDGQGTNAPIPSDKPLASETGSVLSPPIPTGEPGNQQELDARIPGDMLLASGTGVAPSPPIPAGAQEHHLQLGDASPLGSPADLAAVANATEAASPPTVTQ